jgi:hypothetical protein
MRFCRVEPLTENAAKVDTYVARCEAEIERHQPKTPRAPTIEELSGRP